MPPIVFVLLAAAAVLHTLWNVLLKTSDDPLATATRAVSWGFVVATPFVGAAWWIAGRPSPSGPVWLLAVLSGLLELSYFSFLSAAYRRGDLSSVYPVARGTAPLVAVLSGLVLLGERLVPLAVGGVALLIAGIWLARGPGRPGPAFGYALATGVMIAAYSTVDRVGVQLAPPWLYAWVLWLCTAIALQASAVVRRELRRARRLAVSAPSSTPGRDLIVGTAMLGAWFLVLTALSMAPLAVVAPLRESAVVLAAGWGILRLGEREGAALRIVGALAIVVGVIAVAVA